MTGEAMAVVVVVMGVSGCGKSTVGQALADRLGCTFYDGDDFQPPENIAKMSSGLPLNDEDRAPWLARLHDLAHDHLSRGQSAVIAASALKRRYRDQLRAGNEGLRFLHLAGSFDVIWERMERRAGHFMKPEMLRSQFETLEPPGSDEAIVVDVALEVPEIINIAVAALESNP
jgi:gluconokinase